MLFQIEGENEVKKALFARLVAWTEGIDRDEIRVECLPQAMLDWCQDYFVNVACTMAFKTDNLTKYLTRVEEVPSTVPVEVKE
jgi:hypothetical protein